MLLSARSSCVVVAYTRADHLPESARSCGKASIALSVTGIVIGVLFAILIIVFTVVTGGITLKASEVSNLFHCLHNTIIGLEALRAISVLEKYL